MEQLGGKVAVVTGAASGIGRALALRFAREGMKVMAADIDEAGLDDVVDELVGSGAVARGHVADVARAADVEDLAEATIESFGAVHVVCNNAGVGGGGPVAGFDVDQWARVIDIDLWSVLHGLRVFLPKMIEQGEGHIVNTASLAGLISPPFMGPYGVSKFGVVAISEAAHHELALFAPGVGISVLCPGWVRTNIASNMPSDGDDGGDDDPLAAMMRQTLEQFIDSGMDPADVAGQVLDAVRNRRFYILTHPASRAIIEKRMRAILDGDPPPTIGMEHF